MANKRMFTMKIVDSDAFLDMPLSAQCLYFHLNMRADDDGFIGNPKRIMRLVGAAEDDLKLLIAKRFLLTFDDGVIVIKHWRMHNTLSKQRYHETQYTDEKGMLRLKENMSYSLTDGTPIDDTKLIEMFERRTSGEQVENADIDLDLDLDIDIDLDKDIDKKKKAKPARHKYGEYNNVLLSDEDMNKLQNEFPTDYKERIERLSCYIASTGKSYKNHLATIRNWARRDSAKPEVKKQNEQEWDIPDEFFGGR